MARWRRHPGGVPERLCRFVASEWPAAECSHDALRLWVDACIAWLDAEPGRSLPFGLYGCPIDVIREWGRYRDEMPYCPKQRRPDPAQSCPW